MIKFKHEIGAYDLPWTTLKHKDMHLHKGKARLTLYTALVYGVH